MELINIAASISAPVEIVWPLFSDFGGVDRLFPSDGVPPLGPITMVDVEGDGIGSIRTIHFSGADPVEERLTRCDHNALIMEYEALSLPIGVEDYSARIAFQREAIDNTVIVYTARGVPTFQTAPELRDLLTPLFSALVAGARQIAEQSPATA